jgi:O-antigen ligase
VIRNFKTLEKYLVVSFLFLLPTQLALHFWPNWAFVFGLRVDILAPAIYLTDVFIVALLIFKVFKDKEFFKPMTSRKTYLGLFVVFAVINCVFSSSPPVSVYRWFKVAEYSFAAYYFFRQDILKLSSVIKILFWSSITFSLIGIFQFLKGATIGGPLYYLGERTFNMGTPGIALVSLNGVEHLRAYSTFSHPNSLAGFLGAVVLFILLSGKLRRSFFNFFGLLIILVSFLLSFSISAYLGIFLAFSFYLFSKNKGFFRRAVITSFFLLVLGSLLLPLLSPWFLERFPFVGQNIGERLDLAYLAGKMISQRFLIGVGLGTFIVNLPLFKGIFSYSWLLQPVHNIFLLVLSETGIVGLLIFCFAVYKTLVTQLKSKTLYLILPVLFILFTGLFDHYTLTLQQNMLLFSIFMGISFNVKMA